MKWKITIGEAALAAVLVTGLSVGAWQVLRGDNAGARTDPSVDIKLPQFSTAALAGRSAFDANCMQCHGVNGSGTDKGPPLLHGLYNPGHHPDEAFRRAVRNGVQQHHWPFGNMPPQPQVSDEQLAQIVRYVRELQQANGIVYQEHRM